MSSQFPFISSIRPIALKYYTSVRGKETDIIVALRFGNRYGFSISIGSSTGNATKPWTSTNAHQMTTDLTVGIGNYTNRKSLLLHIQTKSILKLPCNKETNDEQEWETERWLAGEAVYHVGIYWSKGLRDSWPSTSVVSVRHVSLHLFLFSSARVDRSNILNK